MLKSNLTTLVWVPQLTLQWFFILCSDCMNRKSSVTDWMLSCVYVDLSWGVWVILRRPGTCFCGTAIDGMYKVVCFDLASESLVLTSNWWKRHSIHTCEGYYELKYPRKGKKDTAKSYRNMCKIKWWVFLLFLWGSVCWRQGYQNKREFFCKSQKNLNWLGYLSHILWITMLLLNKTLSQSLSIMLEAVMVVGLQRQFPSPKGARRALSWNTMSSFGCSI